MNTPNLNLPYLTSGQAGAEFTVNQSLNILDALVRGAVTSRNINSAPPNPQDGQMFLIGSSPTGDFENNANELALYYSGWIFIDPKVGTRVWVINENILIVFNGTTWVTI